MNNTAAVSAIVGSSALCAGAAVAYAVRGRSSQIFGASVFRGPRTRRAIALTFDDGPSEGTPALLNILEPYRARATFFQCGANVRRLPEVARRVAAQGHEIGNHSDTHPLLCFHSGHSIVRQFGRAQETLAEVLGRPPVWMRAPFGVRWFGFRAMQRALGLRGVMWSILARDWTLDAAAITARVLRRVKAGDIICLHDGRELTARPNIEPTLEAVRRIVPALSEKGYQFQTVSQLLCPTNL